jgi:photosystem II stability/assembly factor-like uncharacterized protein
MYSSAVAPTNPPTLYAGATASGTPLLKSTDNGGSWAAAGAVLSSRPEQLVAHPTDPDRVYAVSSSYFYRSADRAATWNQVYLGSNTYGNDIVINPANPQVIYVPGYKYDGTAWKPNMAKSTDGGATWTHAQIDTITCTTVYAAAIDPVDTTVVYAGAWFNSVTIVYRSTDCGATWTRNDLPANAYYIYSFYIDPAAHNTVLAGTLYGVYRSTDAGATWTQQSTNNYNYRIVRDPGNPSTLYSAAYSYVYRSTDAGLTWAISGTGIAGTYIRTVLTVPGQNGTVFAGSTAGMHRSTDYGATWTAVNNGIIVGNIPVVAHVPGVPGASRIEFVDYDNFRTTDNGATWQSATTPLSCGNVCAIAFDPNDGQRVWMLEGSG